MRKRIVAAMLTACMAVGAVNGCAGNTNDGNSADISAEGTSANTGNLTGSAGGEASGSDTTITFWHSMGGVNGEAIDTLVEKFNKENTFGIKVDSQYQGSYDDAINKLKSAQIGNMGADLVQIYDIGTRFMIDSGWVVPMQELIDGDSWDLNQVEPNIAAYYTVNKTLYSMPFNSSTPILYYNKDMFEKAGITKVPESLSGIAAIGEDLLSRAEPER